MKGKDNRNKEKNIEKMKRWEKINSSKKKREKMK